MNAPPRQPGRDRRVKRSVQATEFTVTPVPPFRLEFTAWALRRRPQNIIDRMDGGTWRRVVALAEQPVEICARQEGPAGKPRLRITVTGKNVTSDTRRMAREVVDRALGLRTDLGRFYSLARRDPRLKVLVAEFRGLKPPRFPTVFEALVNAIACQQLSLVVGLALLGRLAAACGPALQDGSGRRYGFPRARDLMRLSPDDYRAMGFSRQKTRALIELAAAVEAGELDLESFAVEDNRTAIDRLLAIRGVGRWSAEYVLLRGLGRLDVFPGDDAGAQKALAAWLGRKRPLDYAGVERAVAAWQPYAGLIYFHLLLKRLKERRVLGASS